MFDTQTLNRILILGFTAFKLCFSQTCGNLRETFEPLLPPFGKIYFFQCLFKDSKNFKNLQNFAMIFWIGTIPQAHPLVFVILFLVARPIKNTQILQYFGARLHTNSPTQTRDQEGNMFSSRTN